MCVFALFLIGGVLSGEAMYGTDWKYISIPIVAFVVALVALAIPKKTRHFVYIPLAFAIGLSCIMISNAVYDSKLYVAEDMQEVNIVARTASESILAKSGSDIFSDEEKYYTRFYVDEIYIDDVQLNYSAYVIIEDEPEETFSVGDMLFIHGSLVVTHHEKFSTEWAQSRANGNAYFVVAYNITKLTDGKPKPVESVRQKIKEYYHKHMSKESASIAQALMLGDKFGFDPQLKSDIANSGLSHVLAVSGLHITALSAALYFVLKKLKLKPMISFVVVAVITFLYVMLCSFSASALRAFIMGSVFNLAASFGRKKDNLTTLAFAAILILLARPTAIMELGFLLSFYSMLGIFVLAPPITRFGMRIVKRISPAKLRGRGVAEACAISLAATIFTYPIVAYEFGFVSSLFMLSNLVVLPYVMVIYVVLLVVTLFALVTTLGQCVWISSVLTLPFYLYVKFFGELPHSAVSTLPLSVVGIVLFTACALFASDLNLMPRRKKLRRGMLLISASLVAEVAVMLATA